MEEGVNSDGRHVVGILVLHSAVGGLIRAAHRGELHGLWTGTGREVITCKYVCRSQRKQQPGTGSWSQWERIHPKTGAQTASRDLVAAGCTGPHAAVTGKHYRKVLPV